MEATGELAEAAAPEPAGPPILPPNPPPRPNAPVTPGPALGIAPVCGDDAVWTEYASGPASPATSAKARGASPRARSAGGGELTAPEGATRVLHARASRDGRLGGSARAGAAGVRERMSIASLELRRSSGSA